MNFWNQNFVIFIFYLEKKIFGNRSGMHVVNGAFAPIRKIICLGKFFSATNFFQNKLQKLFK